MLPLLVIYISDVANHYFYYGMVHLNQPKSVAILLLLVLGTVLLQAMALGGETFSIPAAKRGLENVQEPLILLLFLAMGGFQAAAYMPPPGMDFTRYWLVADAIRHGLPYAANTGIDAANQAIGMTGFIIDLPLYPVMMAASFAIFGHTVAAAYFPIVACNTLIPPLAYLLFREFFASRIASISLASLVVLFPLLRFYTLNFPVPDSIFLASLVSCSWLFVRLVKKGGSALEWAAFGALAAATALVRTEGIAYASLYVLVALLGRATLRQKAIGLLAYVTPLALFIIALWTSFGIPWPHTFAGALGAMNLWTNLQVLVVDEFFTSAIRIPSGRLAAAWGLLLLLALAGSLPLIHRPRRLAVLFVPAWVNLLMVLLAHPRVSGARLWFDFFRHVSYVLPIFVLGAAAAVGTLRGRPGNHRVGMRVLALTVLNILVFLGVMWDFHGLSEPSWNFGPSAVNLLSQERPNYIDYVDHPYLLPVLEYDVPGTHSEPRLIPEFFANYPDQLLAFYRPYDAVKLMTGTAYQTGSLFIYLAALVLAVFPAFLDAVSALRRTGPQWRSPTPEVQS